LSEAIKITRQTLINNLAKLLDQYGLQNKIITYVKDEGLKLNTMIIALEFGVKCEVGLSLWVEQDKMQRVISIMGIINPP
jgi:hypothetical protein